MSKGSMLATEIYSDYRIAYWLGTTKITTFTYSGSQLFSCFSFSNTPLHVFQDYIVYLSLTFVYTN